ncbi:hypothetical protein LB143_000792 [Citrobacter freundii]
MTTNNHPRTVLYHSIACTRYAKYSAKQQHKATAVISATQWLML